MSEPAIVAAVWVVLAVLVAVAASRAATRLNTTPDAPHRRDGDR